MTRAVETKILKNTLVPGIPFDFIAVLGAVIATMRNYIDMEILLHILQHVTAEAVEWAVSLEGRNIITAGKTCDWSI